MKNKITRSAALVGTIALLAYSSLSLAEVGDKSDKKMLQEANLKIATMEQQVNALQASFSKQKAQLANKVRSAQNACRVSDMPYADPGSFDTSENSAIKQLAQKIMRDNSDAKKYTANNLMFYVPEGGYQQALLTLAKSFDYNKVVFEDNLDKKKYNCKIESGFWVKGRDFASLSEQIIKPYRISMTIHTPDSVVVMKRLGKKNPCKSK